MNQVLVVIAVILLVFVLFLLFRLSLFVNTYVWRTKPGATSGNFNSYLFVCFFIFGSTGVYSFYRNIEPDLLGAPSSEHGYWLDATTKLTFILILIIFFITQAALALFMILYRYDPYRKALFYPMNLKLEIVWTAIPLGAFLLLFINSYLTWTKVMEVPPEDPVIVEVTGMQFNWIARYPGADNKLGKVNARYIDQRNVAGLDLSDPASLDDFVTGEIRVPVDRNILFKIRSLDVIHSVNIPHFRLKMDAVPGMPTQFAFKPIRTTNAMRMETSDARFNFSIYCAELCGRGHYNMKTDVVVEEEIAYQDWYKQQGSWLARHQEYLRYVPDRYQERAKAIIGNTPPETTEEDADFFYDNTEKLVDENGPID